MLSAHPITVAAVILFWLFARPGVSAQDAREEILNDPLLKSLDAVLAGSPEDLASHWDQLEDSERLKVLETALKFDSVPCVELMFTRGLDPHSFDGEGRLYFLIAKSKSMSKLFQARMRDFDQASLHEQFVHRVLIGIECGQGKLSALELEGIKDLPDPDTFIDPNHFAGEEFPDVRLIFEQVTPSRIEFRYWRNWRPLSGIAGGGEFTKKGPVWKIKWRGAVEG